MPVQLLQSEFKVERNERFKINREMSSTEVLEYPGRAHSSATRFLILWQECYWSNRRHIGCCCLLAKPTQSQRSSLRHVIELQWCFPQSEILNKK
ncbi:hypothetical protein MPTK1_2g26690 [Marchantia polymorpha subsp. ruderalis]|uniref:Uncharacterized protein n=1 Tax=Marchantia polymorpha TaxID=3197 RepID=A0A2R6XB16_MARPO|nr:hypothetical protein MARPO_0025s0015 [Marchantia polymorpha]PTQ43311.1 hypothetical protein MARPO_0025s0015 [Marchantia polymorpha]BBN03822.1 hypothetical protein Mp_2g26690 [Marchantia polymorpha subsp. ruderalis]BBN03823.1 hypothetical protein Mp_2g26690 [Marchantia polymorpha subsp. ruderalis]|eukprot:PTQ43310.1 hypothetical protein MARPO_0025s0015 [Marchantia polymorpha]